jgi:phenylacetyl-CoA:acceptor oxidoreductase subunit 2
VSYGPDPRQQPQWDWRAAGNLIGGGAGSGLIVATVLSGLQGTARAALVLAGLALVGAGLLGVWFEIGRPRRAINVFFHPRRSWMTRESWVGAVLMAAGLATLAWPAFGWLAAALALAYVYCQARIVQAARGIPAWRAPRVVPLVIATGLTEGLGLLVLATSLRGTAPLGLLLALGAVVLVRIGLWAAYRRHLGTRVAGPALDALDGAGRWLRLAGTAVPLLGLAVAALGGLSPAAAPPLLALAGLSSALAGSWFKFVLVTRAGFNQGFALTQLPVRGVRRS